MSGVLTVAYLVAGVLFIRSLGGLSKQETARRGNAFGVMGMVLAVLVAAVTWWITTPSIPNAGMVALVGAIAIGAVIGAEFRRQHEARQQSFPRCRPDTRRCLTQCPCRS